MKDVTIVSMSKVYESEDFCRPFISSDKYIDCSDIEGGNCYADNVAMDKLRRRIENVDARGVHFIDSGNYHYISYLFVEKIPRDFELVLIDKHPDCKMPMFDSLMSCGGWIREALIDLPHLKRVYMVGVDTDLVYELDDLGNERDKAIVVRSAHKLFESNLPVYLSIDKDVLDESVLNTNWDQGNMTLEELDEWISRLLDKRYIIGVDICGEADVSEPQMVHQGCSDVNEHILEMLIEKNAKLGI